MVFIFCILISILIFNFFLIKNQQHFYYGLKLPGPWFIPMIGNVQVAMILRPENVFKICQNFRKKYNKTFRFWLGTKLWVFLHSPEETKQALNNSTLHRASEFQQLKILLGNGLLLSEGKKWTMHRKALTPAFHTRILDEFVPTIEMHSNILLNLLKKIDKLDISDYLFHCILDIICETSMGATINSQLDSESLYANAFHEAMHLLFQRMVNPLLSSDFIYQRTKSFDRLKNSVSVIKKLTTKMVSDRKIILENKSKEFYKKSSYDDESKEKRVLLDILLTTDADGNPLSEDDVKDEVNTFLFAGVDTTKASQSFVVYNLGKHKNLQEDIYNEILSVLPDKSMPITNEHLRNLKILNRFIKESQRFHTTVPLTGRETSCLTKIGDFILPKNTTVWINMYGLAHDQEFFPNPDEFDIDRFLDSKHPNYAYLPFSNGLHICIGKRYAELIMKILTIKLIQNFEISLQFPDEELILISEMVLKSKTGINIKLKERYLD